jgi:N12 class adenine-specific DNA methylase
MGDLVAQKLKERGIDIAPRQGAMPQDMNVPLQPVRPPEEADRPEPEQEAGQETGQAADDLTPFERNQLRDAGVTDAQLWDMRADQARQMLADIPAPEPATTKRRYDGQTPNKIKDGQFPDFQGKAGKVWQDPLDIYTYYTDDPGIKLIQDRRDDTFQAFDAEGDTPISGNWDNALEALAQAKDRKGDGVANVERRQDPQTRRRVAEMTQDEMRQALLEDDLTGLGNRRAYEENERKPVQVSVDADSLKWINDNMSHGAGDQMLQAIGRAFKAKGADAYHPSGDEFWVQANTQQEAEQLMQEVAAELENAIIEFELPSGEVITKRGIGLSYGTAETIEAAERGLQAQKAERERTGQRAGRGETPPGVTRSGGDAGVSSQPAARDQGTPGDTAERPSEVTQDEPAELDQPGQRTLEGEQAEAVSEPEEAGDAGPDAETGSGTDVPAGDRAGGSGVPAGRGVSDGEGNVPVSTGGTGERQAGGQRTRDTERRPADDEQDAGSRQPATRGSEGSVDATEKAAKKAPTPKGATTQRAEPAGDRPAKFFTLTPEMNIGAGGAKTKFKNNLKAIQTLKQLNEEGRQATPEEQQILAGYVGWGGLPQAFVGDRGKITKGWEKEAKQLQEALTEAEYDAARRSTQDAHYTSPEIVTEIWKAVKNMGFQGGRVLEPSVGTGNFLGFMPGGVRSKSSIAGVELDHITGGIAQKLYPGANIQAPMGFQEFNMPDGYFDLAIGNPPFGNQKLYDGKRKALSKMSIHNYFFAKSMAGLKPNGVLAMVVSSRLMDGNNKMARDYLAERADLLGAVRLPNNAFLKNAGTEVTTDIIFLRKRREGEQPSGESWSVVNTVKDAKGIEVPLNEYFDRNPGMMLGEWGAYGSMYGPNEPALVARQGQDTNALLQEALASLPKDFMDAATTEPVSEEVTLPTSVENVKVGSMFLDGDQISIRLESEMGQARSEPVEMPSKKAEERVRGLIKVRDVFADLRKAQLTENVKDEALGALRDRLNRVYDQFVKKNGPINLDANKRLFRDDPTWPQLAALEESFDKGISPTVAKRTGETPRKPSAEKAAIFRTRTQQPYKAPEKATTAKDALTASLSEKGRVDMKYMSQLYGKTESAIVAELGDLVFESTPNNWESRDEYLSGNVKQKLAMAERMAKDMPRFERNVQALKDVQPEDIEAVDIRVKPGAHWLPPEVVTEFADHILGNASGKATYNPVMAKWNIKGSPTTAAESQYGTDRAQVSDILTAAANDKSIVIRDRVDENTTVINESATNAANEKIQRVKAEFRRWIWKDDARRNRLVRLYNDTFNTDRVRKYDGSHLTFPGKVGDDIVKLRPHQANAAWRIVQSGTTLLDHVVGAGKTFTMIAGAMELRRTGRAKKPMFAVPNHLVGQWAEDFTKLYPNANILAATKKDFEKGNRKRLFARIATGDWDAVIVAHSSFGKVEMDAEFQERFINQQIRDIDTAISTIRDQEGKGARSIKQIEKQKERLQERLKRLFDAENKDDNLTFGELGVDALFLDEAHEFKNLGFATSMTRVAGLGNPQGSQKAADMFMKVQSILERTGGNNVVFATGTPISNTMAEMYTMQRFLDYQTLQDQGIAHFDAWARMYGEVVTDWELSPTGSYKLNSRFRKFVNLPELMQRYLTFGDVVNRDDINKQLAAQGKRLPVPKIKGGKPNNIVVERSKDQADYIGVPVQDERGNEVYPKGSLVWRAEHLPKKPEKGADNMLKIMSDARKAALDMRLIDPALYVDNPDSKINEAASRIKTLYDQWADDKGAQLVFIDLSTPKGAKAQEANRIRDLIQRAEDGDEAASEQLDRMSPDELEALDGDFSVYDDLRQKLINLGIPESEVAYIHDANTELQKAELFAKVRTGRVRVLMGSTAKMGAGMNVQTRLVGLHHMDAPWRPSDLEQREGRIIRQGNELYDRDPNGFEIEINRYATKQTLDSRMWQTIETKARFIEQVRKGNTKQREIEDLGAESANAAEMKAASSGNPLILEEMDLRQKLRKLEQAEEEHDREQFRIRDAIRREKSIVERGKDRLLKYAQDVKKAKAAPKDFSITVNGQTFDKHKDAGQEILAEAAKMSDAGTESKAIGSYAGFDMTLDNVTGTRFVLTLDGALEHQVDIKDIGSADATGLARRVANTISAIDAEAKQQAARVKQAERDLPKLEEQVQEWDQAEELSKVKARHQLVIAELQPKKDQDATSQDATSAMMSDMGADVPMPKWQPPYSMTGVPRRPDNSKFKIGDRTVTLKPEEKPTRREGIRFMLQDLIGKRIYFGKVQGKSKLGFYRSNNSEVRVKSYDNVEVMAHEMAHYLDMHYRYNKRFTREYKDSKYRKEVEALSYTSKKNLKAKEGFAEFVRLWLTNYSEAKARAPLFTQRFEQVMKDDAVLDRKMKRLQDEMHRWYLQGPRAQFRAKSGRELTPRQQIIEYQSSYPLERYRQQVIDKIHAAKVVERTLKGEVGEAMVSPYKQFQMLNGAESVHEAVMKDGTPRLTEDGYFEFSGKGLNEVFKPVAKHGWPRFDALMEYFKARRGQELMKQGRENLFTDQEIDAGLALGQKYPEFPQVFDEFQKFNGRMLDFYVQMGLIDESQRRAFKKMNQNYVPFHRVIQRIEDGHEMGAGDIQSQLRGGYQNTREIAENIVESLQSNIRAAIIARAKATLYNDIMNSQDGALFAAKIAPDSKKVQVEQAQMAAKMAEAMAEMGLTVSKDGMIMAGDPDAQVTDVEDIAAALEANPALLSFWTFGHKPQTTETYVDSAVVNGKRVYFEVHEPLLVDMLTGLSGLRSGAVMNALYRVKNLQTRTVTSMFQFLGPNAVRDTVSSAIMSRNRFIPVYSTLKGMGHFMFNTKIYKEFRLQGGGYGTRIEARTQETRDRRRLDLPSESGWDAAAKFLAGWDRFTSAFEYGSRIGDYELGVKKGTSPMEAAWEAREIATDFSKMGRNELWAKFLRTVPFMNAGIQGLDKAAREFSEIRGEMKGTNLARMTDKKAVFLMKGSVLTMMSVILWLLNQDDERYQQLTPDQKARFWWIFIPGADTPFKIPRPYDLGHIFATLPEVGLDYVKKRDGKEASEHLAWALVNTVGIGDYPGILQPWVEVQRNEKFTGAPVVPHYMMDIPAEYQYTDRTPIMYRKLGEYLGVSPLVAEHYSKGFLRYVEMIIADASEAALWKQDDWGPRPFNRGAPIDYMTHQFVGQKVPYRTKWTEGYWDLKVKAAAAQQTFNMLQREAIRDPSKAPEFAGDKVNQILIGLNGAFSQIDNAFDDQQEIIASYKYNENMTAEQKESAIESYYEQKNRALEKFYRQAKDALEQVHDEMP